MNKKYIMKEYDEALNTILTDGFDVSLDRTGVGTRNYYGLSTSYNISKRVPILTKRKVAWKSIVKEVLWYISGSSNINDLEQMGSKIWTPWKSDKFTKTHNLPEGSGGYLYGMNLIHFGGDIHKTNPGGFNQLDYVISTLKSDLFSRQACFTFWRPDTNNCAILPACHAFYHFFVDHIDDEGIPLLNCHVFQRSNDYPIGVGMGNLLTATIFNNLIAHQIGGKSNMLYHTGSHCHIYANAIDSTKEYCSRKETPDSPILSINHHNSIYDYDADDFKLSEYDPLPAIDFNIAI